MKKLGVVGLTKINVEVGVIPGSNCYFDSRRDDKSLPSISIGLDHPRWSDALAGLIHESSEFFLAQRGGRLWKSADITYDAGAFVFVFDHALFAEMVDQVACVVATIAPVLSKAYQARKRALGRKKKR